MLKKIKDQDYGFVKNGTIGINIERIWLETEREAKFIREFARTYTHEMLHLVIARAIRNRKWTEIGEERAVRRLCKEKWNREIAQFYG